jgi:hypothetical protein
MVFRYAPSGQYTTLSMIKYNGSWGSRVDLPVAPPDWQIYSISACIAPNNDIFVAYSVIYNPDTTIRKYYVAIYNTTSDTWGAPTLLEDYTGGGTHPIVRNVEGSVWTVWSRDGLGVESAYEQIRYSIYTGSWSPPVTLTDAPWHHASFSVVGQGGLAYLIYQGNGCYIPQPGVANLAYQIYNGATWSSMILLTEEDQHQIYPDAEVFAGDIHVAWWSYNPGSSSYDIYHGNFSAAPPPTPSLRIDPSDINFAPTPVKSYHITNIEATVHNDGDGDATDVLVKFYQGGIQINGDQTIALIPAHTSGTADVDWTPLLEDATAIICVEVDPGGPDETSACTPIEIIYSPETRYVSKAGNDGNDGESWLDAWLTVQHAVDNVYSGDTIIIGTGIYGEQVAPPDFLKEVVITGPDMETNTIFDATTSVELTSIICNGSGNYTTWKNLGIAYLVRTTASVHDINFENILLKEGSSGQVYDGSVSDILFKNCAAYKLTGSYPGFVSTAGIEVKDCIAYECATGIITGNSSYNCAFACGLNFDGAPGPGSIEQDPLFFSAPADDFRLYFGSPCIGAGSGSNIGIYQGAGVREKFSKKGPQNLGCNLGLAFAYTPYSGFGRIPLGDYGED